MKHIQSKKSFLFLSNLGRSVCLLSVVLFVCLAGVKAISAKAEKPVLAVIPGEGDREVKPAIISRLEVALSQSSELVLVERDRIYSVMQELALSAGGFLDTRQAPRLGEILGAQILVFSERMPAAPGGFINRYRLVDSKTSIVLDTLLEEENDAEKDFPSLLNSIDKVIKKLQVPSQDRRYIGILELRNTEPGTALNGTAEALKMFLANDLALSPNVFILDREHLQRLQDEKTLSNLDLELKSSALLVEGGIQHASDFSKLEVRLLLHKMDGTAGQEIKVTVPVNDIQKTRELLQQAILKPLNAALSVQVPASGGMEAQMFLNRVPSMILAGQNEEAVRAAEAANALQPDRQTVFWASRAWYALGKDLVKQLAERPESRTRLIKKSTSQMGDSPPRVIKGTRAERLPLQQRESSYTRTQEEQSRHSQRMMRTAGISAPAQASKRVLEVLLRAVQLGKEYTDRYSQDFAKGLVRDIPMPDPFVDPENEELSRKYFQRRTDSFWGLRFSFGSWESELRDMQNDLAAVKKSFLAAQRAFYKGLMDKDKAAVESYWNNWQRESEIVLDPFSVDNDDDVILSFYRNLTKAFLDVPAAFPLEKFKGFWSAIASPTARQLKPEAAAFFRELSGSKDLLLRLAADRILMRVDPRQFSVETVRAYLEYAAKTESSGAGDQVRDKFYAGFLAPAVKHLAVYNRETLLLWVPKIIEPVIQANNTDVLAEWRSVLWPYINALSDAPNKKPALALVGRCQKIVERVTPDKASDDVNRLRAELDLKLVWLGVKKTADPGLQRYFDNPTIPSYLRQRPQIEPPRPEGPLDMKGFGKLELVYGQQSTYIVTRTKEDADSRGSGVSSLQSFQRMVDPEGNDIFTVYSVEAEASRPQQGVFWAGFEVKKTDLKLAASATAFTSYESRRINRNILLADGSFYEAVAVYEAPNVKISAYRYSLLSPNTRHFLGETRAPAAGPEAVSITSLASGADKLFVGTTAGVFIYPASASLPIPAKPAGQDLEQTLVYSPYSLYKEENADNAAKQQEGPGNPVADKGAGAAASQANAIEILDKQHEPSRHWRDGSIAVLARASGHGQVAPDRASLDDKNALPDNRVLALAYSDKWLYIAIGPADDFGKALRGVSGLVACDPETKLCRVLASSRALNSQNPLEQGEPYQIKVILADKARRCLWIALSGNQKLNGIWRYDLKAGTFTKAVEEDLSVLDMQWSGNKIIYAMYQSGWSLFEPETKTKTWLMGYTVSAWTGANPPLPPKGTQDKPLYGFPKTRLWPFAADDKGNIITVSWDAYEILFHGKAGPVEPLKRIDPSASYITEIAYLVGNHQGIWVVDRSGRVFLLQRVSL